MSHTAIIEQNRQLEYERFEAHRRFEEATDIAERIGYPIDHAVHYEMRNGLSYGSFDTKDRPFREQTEQSLREGRQLFTGVNRFEAVRREHEHQEALLIDKFGRGELDGNVLVKISPVPDAVRDGTADIDGYRRDLLRSFVRVYYRTESGVACRLFSLDQSDQIGMAAVGDLLGIDVDGRNSEDILSDHALVNMDDVSDEAIDELIGQAKSVYDRALELQTGKQFHAGSNMLNQENALGLVMRHTSLLDEHMRDIAAIMGRALEPSVEKELLEYRRKRTTAAMDVAKQGGTVSSANDAVVTEQMSVKDYGGECATGNSVNAVGMAQGSSKEREWKKGTCVACLKPGTVGECAVCTDCEAADNRGVDLMKVRAKALNAQAAAAKKAIEQRKRATGLSPEKSLTKAALVKAQYGQYAEIRKEKTVGDELQMIVDRRSGEVITRL